jgi:alkanesulfonate monooxygenase SsuD/methylene tetrahydromethanopterin reductase-like flavin-dependent oxidoreductase (luciferase family)
VTPRRVAISLKTSPQNVGWTVLDELWAMAGELRMFDGIWMNDHLTDLEDDRSGPSLESFTVAASLAHHVPGHWIGHSVLANTFRHPAILAKQAAVLDQATGGRFILGLGAGWHEFEHRAFGIPLPPLKERIDRLESAVGVLRALFSEAAAAPPGVTRDDPFYPLHQATLQPGPVQRGGPPIYLGGQGPRGLTLAAREAQGWLVPGVNANDPSYLRTKRDDLLARLEGEGRDPVDFDFVAQIHVRDDRPAALATARSMVATGATHLMLGMRPALGVAELRHIVDDVARPLRDELG